jgi:hypothetical protein
VYAVERARSSGVWGLKANVVNLKGKGKRQNLEKLF